MNTKAFKQSFFEDLGYLCKLKEHHPFPQSSKLEDYQGSVAQAQFIVGEFIPYQVNKPLDTIYNVKNDDSMRVIREVLLRHEESTRHSDLVKAEVLPPMPPTIKSTIKRLEDKAEEARQRRHRKKEEEQEARGQKKKKEKKQKATMEEEEEKKCRSEYVLDGGVQTDFDVNRMPPFYYLEEDGTTTVEMKKAEDMWNYNTSLIVNMHSGKKSTESDENIKKYWLQKSLSVAAHFMVEEKVLFSKFKSESSFIDFYSKILPMAKYFYYATSDSQVNSPMRPSRNLLCRYSAVCPFCRLYFYYTCQQCLACMKAENIDKANPSNVNGCLLRFKCPFSLVTRDLVKINGKLTTKSRLLENCHVCSGCFQKTTCLNPIDVTALAPMVAKGIPSSFGEACKYVLDEARYPNLNIRNCINPETGLAYIYGKFAHHEAVSSLKIRVENKDGNDGNYLLPSFEKLISPLQSNQTFFKHLSDLADFGPVEKGENTLGGLPEPNSSLQQVKDFHARYIKAGEEKTFNENLEGIDISFSGNSLIYGFKMFSEALEKNNSLSNDSERLFLRNYIIHRFRNGFSKCKAKLANGDRGKRKAEEGKGDHQRKRPLLSFK